MIRIAYMLIILLSLFGCGGRLEWIKDEQPNCQRIIEQMNVLYCEDAALVGFTSAYLGHEEWKRLTDSFNEAKSKSAYGSGCGQYWGHWYGRRIANEVK